MTGGMDKYWIIPRVGDKELPRVGHQLASCSLIISYVTLCYARVTRVSENIEYLTN